MQNKLFSAIIYKEDNLYVAECIETGVASQGTTTEEALSNLKEAVELYTEEFKEFHCSHPMLTTFEVACD